MAKNDTEQNVERLFVDLPSLQAMLACGRATCNSIAEKANAIVWVGKKRKIYNVAKIKAYMDNRTEV